MSKKVKPAAMYAAMTGKPMPKQNKNDKTLKQAVGKKKGKC